MIWQEFLSGLRDRRRVRKLEKAATHARERELQDIIEHVVDEINPRIRAVSHYRKKLQPSVERALDYCSGLITGIPDSIEVSSKCWRKDPVVKAIFSSAKDLRNAFSLNQDVRHFFDRQLDAPDCYALLSMECNERTVLGLELKGDTLKRDVKQTTVNFTSHRIVKPSLTEAELRKNLEHCAFENLIGYALERITELVAARHVLEEQQHLTEMQLKVAELKSKGLEPLIGDAPVEPVDISSLREKSAYTGKALDQSRARLTTLDDYIDRITEVLGEPQQHFRLRRVSMRLSGMNIKLGEKATASGQTLELTEASLGEHRKRIILIARFPRDDLLPKRNLFSTIG